MNGLSLNQTRPRTSIAILGVPFANITTAETVAMVERMIASRRPHYLVTANVDFLVQARADVELRRILIDADLVLCDGTPLVWVSRLLGNPLPERVAGSDLVPLLIRIAAKKKYRLFFLGAAPESAAKAMANLKAQLPDLVICGHYSPPFRPLLEMDHDEIKRRIQAARPDLLFVSFGCPKQEKWIAMHYRSLGVPVTIGVGATIDFLAGYMRRAPLWMQRSGTEWIFRLLQEPRRLFRRYLKDLWVFGWAVLGQWRQLRVRHPREAYAQAAASIPGEEGWSWIKLPDRLASAGLHSGALPMEMIPGDGRHCLLETAEVKFIDSTGVAALIESRKKVRSANGQMVLLAPSTAVKRALALMRLDDLFETAPDWLSARLLIEARARETSAVATTRANGAELLVWRGEITAANASAVWAQTEARLNALAAGRRQLVIDLSAVRFIDSTGVGLLVRACNLARRQARTLKLTGVQPAVTNVLRLTRVESFLLNEAE